MTSVSMTVPRPSAALRVLTLTTLQQAGLTSIRLGLPVLAPFWRGALCRRHAAARLERLFSTLIKEEAGVREAGIATGVSMTMLYAASFVTLPLFGWFVERTSYPTGWAALIVALAAGYAVSRRIPEPRR